MKGKIMRRWWYPLNIFKYKIAKKFIHWNFLAMHGIVIIQGLNKITNYYPHFFKSIGLIKTNVDPNRKAKNPLEIKTKYPRKRNFTLWIY